MSQRYAPGVRVEIRDAEWRIKCIDHTSDGGELLTCEGLTELVRGREATFLTEIESSIRAQFSVLRQYEVDTWYDQNGSIIFTPSKSLVDVGLPRIACKADLNNGISCAVNSEQRQEHNIALGWNDIQHLKADTIRAPVP